MKATAGAFTGSLALMLLVVNFALDVLRRFDFESERGEVAQEMQAARFFIEDAHMLWESVEEQHRRLEERALEIEGLLATVRAALDEALGAAARVTAQPEEEQPPVQEDDGRDLWSLEHLSLDQAYGAPPELLQARLDELAEDPVLLARFQSLPADLREWDPNAIIAALSREFQVDPSDFEREILRDKVELYRHAAMSVFSRYSMLKRATIPDRIRSGEFHALSGDEFHEAVEREGTLSVALIGQRRIEWRREEYPELNRLDLLHQYLPVVMLEDLASFFAERRTR